MVIADVLQRSRNRFNKVGLLDRSHGQFMGSKRA
jgi:hypothetical protein